MSGTKRTAEYKEDFRKIAVRMLSNIPQTFTPSDRVEFEHYTSSKRGAIEWNTISYMS